MKTPILDMDYVPAVSYGLIESWGAGKTAVDQSDGDDDYFEECLAMSLRVLPVGQMGENQKRGERQ
mgnify:CR=1 FL=1